MSKILKFSFIVFSFIQMNVFAETNTLLNQEGSDIDLSSKINTQKQLNLDNAFVIQLYASWKTLGRLSEENSDKFVELILDKEYNKALLMIPSLKESKMTAIKEASELYLLFQAGYSQNFINRWIEYSATTPFLQTELGLALDQVIGPNATNYLISHGVFLTADKLDLLKKIENHPSKFNYSLQSFKALRGSEKAAEWIGKLAIKDPLRMPLAQSALLFYAKEGKLGASGKILKEVIEPLMTDSSDTEEISLYFMTLGRLLYQAGALDESKKYFDLIPETSRYFLKAKTESLWAHLKAKDFSRTKGELASLELSLFNDKFYPEAYLVSAMANVMLCQFTESRQAINRFINVNKKWAKDIESNISNVDAKEIDPSFFLTNLENVRLSLVKELDLLKTNSLGQNYAQLDESLMPLVVDSKKREINQQWKNRKAMLESALYKMKFVKIELISRMRAVEMNMKIAGVDEVSTQNAALAKNNQMSFPVDKTIWGDEIFHMSASVKNKCQTGNLK